MRLLIVSCYAPDAGGDGAQLRLWHLAKALARTDEIRLVYAGAQTPVPDGVTGHAVAPPTIGAADRLQYAARAALGRDPILVQQLRSTGLEAAAREQVSVWNPDCVLLTNGPAAYLGPILGRPVVLETIDSYALNETELVRGRGPAAPLKLATLRSVKDFDRRTLPQLDAVVTVADRDARWMRELAPGARVHVISNGVDNEYFDPAAPGLVPSEGRFVAFHGVMNYLPNVVAAEHLVNDVMPLVWARDPDLKVHLVGRRPDPRVSALAGDRVVVTGPVPDLRPELLGATACVFPLRSGTGVKNKVLEAASLARPLVATPAALGDIELVDGRSALIADDAAGLAEAILTTVDDPDGAAARGRAAREVVLANHVWASAAQTLREVCNVAVQRHGGGRG